MAITKVLGPRGETRHDCAAAGCEVSWDGVELATGRPVEGAGGIPEGYVQLDESTVQARAPEADGA